MFKYLTAIFLLTGLCLGQGLKNVSLGSVSRPARQTQPESLLVSEDFEDCSFLDSVINRNASGGHVMSDARVNGLAHTGNCSAATGVNGLTSGIMLSQQFPATTHVWWDGYVYFPVGLVLPTSAGRSPHLWRLYSNFGGLDKIPGPTKIHMDFNIPAGTTNTQLALFVCETQANCPNHEYVANLAYNPSAKRLQGLWQHLQLDINLGTPGSHDGYFRFYSDSGTGGATVLIGSLEHQRFLPADADTSFAFRYADLQSNIGGGTGNWLTSPAQGWYVDDIRICANGPC